MANIRQDQAQLIITIDAKESAEYQKTLQNTAKGVQDIKKLTAGTDEYNKVLNEQAEISRKLASSDFSKLNGKQLSDRRSQLIQLQRTLPQVTFAEAGFERELQRVNQALATNAQRTRAVSTEMATTTKSVGGFTSFLKGSLPAIAAFFAVDRIAGFVKGLISGASQMDAVQNRFETVFGESTALVEAFAEESAINLGLTVKEYEKVAAATGDLLVPMGFARRDAALLSKDVIDLSAALAIWEGGTRSTEEITQILNKALLGEREQLKALGVSLSEDDVKQRLRLKGQEKLTGEALKQAKALATLEIITENSADATTAFAERSESAAQVSGRVTAKLRDQYDRFVELIQPALSLALVFSEKLVGGFVDFINTVTSGEKATGRFSTAINFAAGILKIAGNVISFVAGEVVRWYDGLVSAIKVARELPIIGTIVNAIASSFNLIITAVSNSTATLAGFKAAFQQAFDNAADYVNSAITSIKIFAAEAELALTFDDAEEERLRKRIKLLENQKAYYAKAGKTVGQAYVDAYNEQLQKEAIESELSKKKTGKVVTGGTVTGGGGGDGGGAKDKDKKQKKEDQFSDIPKSFIISSTAQIELEKRLKAIDEAAKREQLIIQENYAKGLISEDEYNLEKLRITSASFANKIQLLDAAGQTETDKRRELNLELLNVDKELIQERANQISELSNADLNALEAQFANRLISEEEYFLQKQKIDINFYDEQLRLLAENGLTETEVYKKILEAKAKAQKDYNDGVLSNEAKTQLLKEQIQSEGIDAAKDLFSLGAELLSQDEKARKKHATAIKAFESAAILINALSEISAIHKKYAAIPGGTFVAIAQSVATAVRAGIAIAKVNAQQFFLGGKIKTVSGQLIQERPNINPLPGGDNVLIAAKPGEVMFNEPQQENLKRLAGPDIFRRLGIPGFADGGLIPSLPRTTPTISPQVLSRNPAPIAADNGRIDMLLDAVQQITRSIPEAISAMDLKTHVVYTDFNKVQNTVNEIKRISSY